jgi:uncharacterized protein
MWKLLCLGLIELAMAGGAAAQELSFPAAAAGDATALSKFMPDLARQVMAVYKDDDRGRYLDNLFRLQTVAGQYADAAGTLLSLRAVRAASGSLRAQALDVQYEISIRAEAAQRQRGMPFNAAFRQSFEDVFGRLDDRTSALVISSITLTDEAELQRALNGELARHKGAHTIPFAAALTLVRAYQADEAYRRFLPLTPALIDADDKRRYLIEKDILVPTDDNASVCAIVVRPRSGSGRLPTLLNFTIYTAAARNLSDARRTASNGYVGVVGLTRGKGCSPAQAVPYQYDGADAAALIDWISTRPWSDSRVGMYGGSYEGFTQWAAAKHRPKALKALMPGAPVGPGIDVPMEGNVFWNFIYPFPFYTTNVKGLDNATYYDSARWNRLDRNWYVGGGAYRTLEGIDGTPNPIFDQWIAHPGYDEYWRRMIPYGNEFARVNIPVLATAGYYYGGPGAAVWYFSQHYEFDASAEHYLVIGPYDHLRGHRGTIDFLGDPITVIGGYELDPVAQLDMGELRYQWFDYLFKGAAKPALLKDKVNYEVAGANVWKHAPTLKAMAHGALRFYLSAQSAAGGYRLAELQPVRAAFIVHTVDLADRRDVDDVVPGGGITDRALDTTNGIEFVSDPIKTPIETSGLFSGRLELMTNKRDFDFNIALYALTPQGDYLQLSQYWSRASYVGDRRERKLLMPGKRLQLDFQSMRLMSRQLQAGTRVIAVLSVIKESGRQINYGTGKDVSDETIADAGEPLQIKWFAGSYIDLPVAN